MGLKVLLEKRAEKQAEMKRILDLANTEKRTINKEEQKQFEELEKEILDLDATIAAIQAERAVSLTVPVIPEEEKKEPELTIEEREYKLFDSLIRNIDLEYRDVDYGRMTKGDNGHVIPTTLANKLIEKVVDMCPIYSSADRYNLTGTLQIPYYDDSTHDIKVAYADEFTDPQNAENGKFLSISLNGFLARAVAEISKSLINHSQFDIVGFVINRMARNIALFIENELLHGTSGKIDGLSGVTIEVETASENVITADELIDLQESIPDVYQGNAYWIMNKATRTAIRKLKDGQGNYLLDKDAQSRWGYTLFGKDVYTSDNMDELGVKNKTVIYYGDYRGLAVKVSEDINMEILRETKARQHAIEIVSFFEMDAKVQNTQMIAKMTTKKV